MKFYLRYALSYAMNAHQFQCIHLVFYVTE